jgi:hypothetical protein
MDIWPDTFKQEILESLHEADRLAKAERSSENEPQPTETGLDRQRKAAIAAVVAVI